MNKEVAFTVKVEVPVEPRKAFDMFTREMNAWYRGGPFGWSNPAKAIGIKLEPGVGGRWLEVWDSDEVFEIGRVLEWEEGSRLLISHDVLQMPKATSRVRVRFRAIAPQRTRVVLTHSAGELSYEVDTTPIIMALRGWRSVVDNFQITTRISSEEEIAMTNSTDGKPTIFPALRYQQGLDVRGWFRAVGFEEWMMVQDAQGRIVHGEMKLGVGSVSIGEIGAADDHELVDAAGFGIAVYVEDVDAHYEDAKSAGLRIEQAPYDTDFGARMYSLRDPGGNLWVFGNYRPGT